MRPTPLGRLVAAPAVKRMMAHVLDQDPDFKVLRRIRPLSPRGTCRSSLGERTLCVVDVVTTGLDVVEDRIISLAVQSARFDGRGVIVDVGLPRTWFEDPRMPIPTQVTLETGICHSHVAGRSIGDGEAFALISTADLVVSHGSGLASRFVQPRLGLDAMDWACTSRDIDWQALGFRSTCLDELLARCGWYLEGSAGKDRTNAVLHLLAHELGDGTPVLASLLDRFGSQLLRIEVPWAPAAAWALLRDRGYRSGPGERWTRAIRADAMADERAWLASEIHRGAHHLVCIAGASGL